MRIFTLKVLYCNVPLFTFPFPGLEEWRGAYRALVGKSGGKSHVENLSIDRS
jgi:hypothetical protein